MFGHPAGLKTLFFTELWERMSFYGMRSLLILFLAASIEKGGFGLTDKTAGAILGIYMSMVYLFALPGGWIADRILGLRQSVFFGGILITAGHFSMAIPSQSTFYAGLVLIVLGTGLLKPNISALVSELYPEGGGRRDAGFSIYYMGINIGAFFGPIICGWLGQKVNWHLGFSAAGVGMVLGLIQYRIGLKRFGDIGIMKTDPSIRKTSIRQLSFISGGLMIIMILASLLQWMGVIALTAEGLAKGLEFFIAVLLSLYFAYLLILGKWTKSEKKRIGAILILTLSSVAFFSGFEQASSSMNLFADRMTDLSVWLVGGKTFSLMGWEIFTVADEFPSTWFQSVNPFFIVLLAPIFAWLWVWLRHREPSIPVKFGIGLMLLGIAFFVLTWGSINASAENKVSPAWLIVTYWLLTTGELCLSPVGLSSVTKLSPKALVGQMMGIWFAGAGLANLIAGQTGGLFESVPLPQLFGTVATVGAISGIVLILFKEPIKKLCAST